MCEHWLPKFEQLDAFTIEEVLILRRRPTGVTVAAGLTMLTALTDRSKWENLKSNVPTK